MVQSDSGSDDPYNRYVTGPTVMARTSRLPPPVLVVAVAAALPLPLPLVVLLLISTEPMTFS